MAMLVLELIGGIILLAVCIARILVAYRKHFLPYHSERFGVITFILACLFGWAISIFYGITGVQVSIHPAMHGERGKSALISALTWFSPDDRL